MDEISSDFPAISSLGGRDEGRDRTQGATSASKLDVSRRLLAPDIGLGLVVCVVNRQ